MPSNKKKRVKRPSTLLLMRQWCPERRLSRRNLTWRYLQELLIKWQRVIYYKDFCFSCSAWWRAVYTNYKHVGQRFISFCGEIADWSSDRYPENMNLFTRNVWAVDHADEAMKAKHSFVWVPKQKFLQWWRRVPAFCFCLASEASSRKRTHPNDGPNLRPQSAQSGLK